MYQSHIHIANIKIYLLLIHILKLRTSENFIFFHNEMYKILKTGT
jgi:hypothetical protein